MLDIKITRTLSPKEKPSQKKMGFGNHFTDHMFLMDYSADKGWHDARIVPYENFSLDPSCMVLHYAQEIFEGLKAYRTPEGNINIFRPDCNGDRFALSADRMCMPVIETEDFVQSVKALVEVDQDWIPTEEGTSLYIRPFMFASDNELGAHPSKTYVYCVILSPSGAYFGEDGLAPVKIYVEDEYIRAAPGGTGEAKCGGNYAASLKATKLAEDRGYSQVLWLDGVEKKYVEEAGAMNIMFKISGKVYTAPTDGTVLRGVTRRSAIELMKDWGYEVLEERLAIEDVFEAGRNGEIEEIFLIGTAAVICPVSNLEWKDEVVTAGDGTIGELTQKLYDTITGIQFGKIADTKGWTVQI